jgi:hypothetical protein
MLNGMSVDTRTGVADRIYALPPAEPADLGARPAVERLSHRVWNQRVEIRCRVTEPCFARLSYAYYPYLEVRVDDKPVTPLETSGRFMAVRLEAGAHTITIEPYLSPLRKGLFTLDALLLVTGICYCAMGRRRCRT